MRTKSCILINYFSGLNLDAISVNPEDLLGVALDIMGQDPGRQEIDGDGKSTIAKLGQT